MMRKYETSLEIVNREKQRKEIEELFTQLDDLPFAVSEYYGVGGIGKSRVLEIVKSICRRQKYPLAIIDLLLSGRETRSFRRYELLLRISDQIDLYTDFALGRMLVANQIRNDKLTDSSNIDEDKLLVDFQTCLSEALGKKPLILILDSIEHCPDEIFDWFGREFIAPMIVNRVIPSIAVFLAGRGPRVRESQWPGILKKSVRSYRLNPLNFEATSKHIAALPPQNTYQKVVRDIYSLSNGHPYSTEAIVYWLSSMGVSVDGMGSKKKDLAHRMMEEVISRYILSDADAWVLPFLEVASYFRWILVGDLHQLLSNYRTELCQTQPVQWTTARLVDLQKQPLHLIYLGKDYYKLEETLRKLIHTSLVLLFPEESAQIHQEIGNRVEQELQENTGQYDNRNASQVLEVIYHQTQAALILESTFEVSDLLKRLLKEYFDPRIPRHLEVLGFLKNLMVQDSELVDLLSDNVIKKLVIQVDEYLLPKSSVSKKYQNSHLTIEFFTPSEYRVSWFRADQMILPTERVHSARRFNLDEWRQRTQDISKTAFAAYLPQRAQEFLRKQRDWAIQLSTNRSDIPWELLHDGKEYLCLSRPVGRRPQMLKEPKDLPSRLDGPIRVLVVGDPTDDLRGAKDEAEEIAKTLLQVGCEVDLLLGSKQATAKEFVIKVRNQNYDIIHYAGHGYFDPNTPLLSGLLFDDGPVFAEELERVINSRVFVFLSACDAGFTKSAESNVGFIGEFIEGIATSVMIGGAIGCLGPMWKIGDDIAKEFALSFYQLILEGNPIGEAVRQARIHAREIGANNFWKSWVLYGDPLQSFSFDKK